MNPWFSRKTWHSGSPLAWQETAAVDGFPSCFSPQPVCDVLNAVSLYDIQTRFHDAADVLSVSTSCRRYHRRHLLGCAVTMSVTTPAASADGPALAAACVEVESSERARQREIAA